MAVGRILVVDDEPKIREIVRRYLEQDGYFVDEAADGDSALARFRIARPDLVVLDLMMPGLDGIEVLRQIRTAADVPVILLTARAEEVDKLVGLAVGADDYVTKPFSPRELVARIKVVLRRAQASARDDDGRLAFGSLLVDISRREVVRDGTACELTALEFDLLVALARAPGRVFSRRQLLEKVWGFDYFGDERVVDVHIRSIRRALGDSADSPELIGTVRGVGYKFLPAPS